MLTKSRLAILLSKLKQFEDPDPAKEQYSTDSEIAAKILWNAYMIGDINGKLIADLGCGTGVLGIGALLLGARWVHFVEIDKKAIEIAKENFSNIEFETGKAHFVLGDIRDFDRKVDVVVQNPPFGVQREHADREFLLKSFEIADVVYSFHKLDTKSFVESIARDNGFKITHLFHFSFPLKRTMAHHTKRIERIRVGCWRLVKQKTI